MRAVQFMMTAQLQTFDIGLRFDMFRGDNSKIKVADVKLDGCKYLESFYSNFIYGKYLKRIAQKNKVYQIRNLTVVAEEFPINVPALEYRMNLQIIKDKKVAADIISDVCLLLTMATKVALVSLLLIGLVHGKAANIKLRNFTCRIVEPKVLSELQCRLYAKNKIFVHLMLKETLRAFDVGLRYDMLRRDNSKMKVADIKLDGCKYLNSFYADYHYGKYMKRILPVSELPKKCPVAAPPLIILKNFTCIAHEPKAAHEFSCSCLQAKQSSISVRFNLTQEIRAFNLQIILDVLRKDNSKITVVNITVDGCKYLKSLYNNFVYGKYFRGIQRVSNLPKSCPVAANTLYEIRNFTVVTDANYPSNVPPVNYVLRIKLIQHDKPMAEVIAAGAPLIIMRNFTCLTLAPKEGELNCSYLQKKDGPAITVRFNLTEITKAFNLQLIIYMLRKDNSKITMLNVNLDGCKYLSSMYNNFVYGKYFRGISRVSNIPKRCPVPAHTLYEIRNFTVITASDYPSNMPPVSFELRIKIIKHDKAIAEVIVAGAPIIFLKNLSCPIYQPKALNEFSCSFYNTKLNPVITVRFNLKDITRSFDIHIEMNLIRGDNTVMKLVNAKLEGCKYLGSLYNNFVYGKYYERILRVSNLPRKCPVPANTLYEIRNFTVVTAGEYPGNMPPVNFQVVLKFSKVKTLLGAFIFEGVHNAAQCGINNRVMYNKFAIKAATVLILIMPLAIVEAKRSFTIELYNMSCSILNHDAADDLSCLVLKKKHDPTLAVRFSLKRRFAAFELNYKVSLVKKDNSRLIVTQQRVDGCKYIESFYSNVNFGKFFKRLQSASNLPKRCPVEPNKVFEIRNYTIISDEYPAFIPECKFELLLHILQDNRPAALVYLFIGIVY
ncbi:CG34260 [Drosophila busckii]|uniref:CG34260 n=1 Tax=Drosophila busckii TaxID=30019 RepID=A0A0M4EC27_DROBS|nr:CG34260 [Drosophila busckii]